jgi:hypothetical protein
MKKINVLYWIFTALFGAFMMFSAIPNILNTPESVEFVSAKLGYPEYLIVFLGAAKALGVIGILVPGFNRIKEWAYAGLFFDLLGATYSIMMVDGAQPGSFFMLVPFALGGLSYVLHHKRLGVQVVPA